MGGGTWTSKDWSTYTSTRGISASSTVSDMYKATTIKDFLNPKGVDMRESCDSTEHPNSSPIILGLDVTGSMGSVLEKVAKKLNTLIEEIYDRKPVPDPQIMIMGVGDAECDRFPLQVSQFESDIRIAEQMTDIYFERGGGGNDGESYLISWYFAARHTKLDSMDKHNKKGFIFTLGDEPCLKKLTKSQIKTFIGDDVQADLTAEELLNEVSRNYEVYHLMIEQGSGMRYGRTEVVDRWTNLLGQRAIKVSDYEKIPEIIVSILEVENGKSVEDVVKSWDGSTSVVVNDAIKNIVSVDKSNNVIEF